MKEAVFLTLEECLHLHEEQIRRFGGSAGLRDPGLLESALARPRSGYYQTLFEQAAALMQSLAMNHCFVDGNKRMAMGCAFIFMDWNGFEIDVMGEDAERFLLEEVILGKADVAGIASWLEAHAAQIMQNSAKDLPFAVTSKGKPTTSRKSESARKGKPSAGAKKPPRGKSGRGKV